MDNARRMRRLSHVKRWPTVPTLRTQSVAEHTLNVVYLARQLAVMHVNYAEEFAFRDVVMEQALFHDLDEAINGDEPGGTMKNYDYKALVKEKGQIWAVVKLADLLEALIFVREEQGMGHQRMTRIRTDYERLIAEVVPLIHWHGRLSEVELRINKLIAASLGPTGGDQYG